MTENFVLKFITSGNIDSIIPLYKLLDDKLSDDLVNERFAELVTGDYKIVAIHPYDSNKPVGMMGLSYGMRIYCGSYLELHHMVVYPTWRGHGLSKKLVKYAESYALLRGIAALSLDSYNHAVSAHSLFEDDGYTHIGKHFLKYL